MIKREIKFRTLKANEIEVRPATIKDGNAKMLLYIDSRAATTLLDETVGNLNWQSEFYEVNNKVICKIGIFDEERNIWIWKSDTGSESNVEAEKGQISDCYKRVLSRFGVTELYSAPSITIQDDGYKCTGYKVSEINYNENREIIHLVIVNRFNKEVFRWNINQNPPTQNNNPYSITNNLEWTPEQNIKPKSNLDLLSEFCSNMKQQPDTNKEELLKFYNYYSTKEFKGKMDCKRLYQNWINRS